jgi:hypothetical protein
VFWSLNFRLLVDDSVNKKIKFDPYLSNFLSKWLFISPEEDS